MVLVLGDMLASLQVRNVEIIGCYFLRGTGPASMESIVLLRT